MQRVERKQHKVRRGRRLAWILGAALLLAVCLGAALLLKGQEEPAEPTGHVARGGSLVIKNRSDLQSVTVTRKGGETWTVIRDEDGNLRVEGEDGDSWTVDELLEDRIADAAVNLVYEDILTEDPAEWRGSEAAFGLAEPGVTATIRYRDGEEMTIRIGNRVQIDEQVLYYMCADGDDRLFLLPQGVHDDLNMERAMLHPVKKPEIYQALLDRITIYGPDGEIRAEWALQGALTDRDAAENWMITAPFEYPADWEALLNMRETAENFRLGIFEGEATEERRAACGLDQPRGRIELHMAEGNTGTVTDLGVYDVVEHEARTVVIEIGGQKSDLVDYVGFEGEIFSVNHFTLSAFTDVDPLSTAARYAVMMPLDSLEWVRMEQEGTVTEYRLVRESAEEGADPVVRCLRNGEEMPYETFSAAYDRLLTVTVSGRLPEGAAIGETHTKYTFHTLTGGTHTLELSGFDAMHDAVTLDGHTLFYLIHGGMTPLP